MLFIVGPEMVQGDKLVMHIGPDTHPTFEYEVAAVYGPHVIELVDHFYNVWEPVLLPEQLAEIKAGIVRVRGAANVKAYLMRILRPVRFPKETDPVLMRPTGDPRLN